MKESIPIPQKLDSHNSIHFRTESILTFDIDHLCEILTPWNLIFKKINRGTDFYGRVDIIRNTDLIIMKSDFSGVLEQSGAPPSGYRTFFVPAEDTQSFYWRGKVVTNRTIGFFPLNSELDATTKPGFRVYVISIPEDLLIRVSNKMGFDWLSVQNNQSCDHQVVNNTTTKELRNLIFQLYQLRAINDKDVRINQIFINIKKKLIEALIIHNFQIRHSFKEGNPNRIRIYKQFKDLIHESPCFSFSSSEVCENIGTSERTLQYVIKSFTGLTPSQYAKAIKLNKARDFLINRNSRDLKINEIASQLGFWHFGKFAADYKRLFNELPSTTLNTGINLI